MIRKAIIVVLTLAAVGTGIVAVLSFQHPIHLRGEEASHFSVFFIPKPFWSVGNGTLEIEFIRCLGQAYDPRVHQFRRVNLFVARLIEVDNIFFSMPNGWIRIDRLYLPLWTPIIMFAAYPSIAFIRGPLRRWRRGRRGLCLKCGYNLEGNVSGVCSECGRAYAMPVR